METIEVVLVDHWKKAVTCKKERLTEIYAETAFSETTISEISYPRSIHVTWIPYSRPALG